MAKIARALAIAGPSPEGAKIIGAGIKPFSCAACLSIIGFVKTAG